MRITKAEKIWLFLTVLFYVLYNLPGVPPYGAKIPAMVHALLTVLPLWIVVFAGTAKIFKIYELKEPQKEEGKEC